MAGSRSVKYDSILRGGNAVQVGERNLVLRVTHRKHMGVSINSCLENNPWTNDGLGRAAKRFFT